VSARVTVSYAGFEGESTLLEELEARGRTGVEIAPDLYAQPGMLMFWTHDFTAPWQSEEWREQMRGQLRPNAFLRLVENRWVSGTENFVDIEAWDACVDPNLTPVASSPGMSVWVGVDASVKRDSTAIVACTWDDASRKVRLVFHRIFQPSSAEPLDFENTIELTIMELMRRFAVRAVRYDPYQMQAPAQRLRQRGAVPMYEAPQTIGYLTEVGSNLYELVKGRNLVVYSDEVIRLAVQRSVAVEGTRGWRLAKEKSSHKIDVVVALAMAAHACVQDSQMQVAQFPQLDFDSVPRDPTGVMAGSPYSMSDFDNLSWR
jgi:phage terminase large subunit-like protein